MYLWRFAGLRTIWQNSPVGFGGFSWPILLPRPPRNNIRKYRNTLTLLLCKQTLQLLIQLPHQHQQRRARHSSHQPRKPPLHSTLPLPPHLLVLHLQPRPPSPFLQIASWNSLGSSAWALGTGLLTTLLPSTGGGAYLLGSVKPVTRGGPSLGPEPCDGPQVISSGPAFRPALGRARGRGPLFWSFEGSWMKGHASPARQPRYKNVKS